jgi:hypothetical protein
VTPQSSWAGRYPKRPAAGEGSADWLEFESLALGSQADPAPDELELEKLTLTARALTPMAQAGSVAPRPRIEL